MKLATHLKIREVNVPGRKKSKLNSSEASEVSPVVLVFKWVLRSGENLDS